MKNTQKYFKSDKTAKIGDLIQNGRHGPCRILSFTSDGEALTRNTRTGEELGAIIGDCDLLESAKPQDIHGSYVTPDGKAQIDFGITYRKGYAEFTASGYFNGSCGQYLEEIAEAYPDNAMVKALHGIWQRFHLKPIEGHRATFITEAVAEFPVRNFYHSQADQFLSANGLKFRATLSDTKTPAWSQDGKHGHHYRVTLSRHSQNCQCFQATDHHTPSCDLLRPARLTFDFWGSIADAKKGDTAKKAKADYEWGLAIHEKKWCTSPTSQTIEPGFFREAHKTELAEWEAIIRETTPHAYDVLACIASDAHTPASFKDWCSEMGGDPDSLKELQTYRRCAAFSRRLKAFFTPAELEQLSEIQ